MDRFIDDRLQRFPFRRNVNHRASWCAYEWYEGAALKGEMVRMDQVANAHDDSTLDDVLQLANVSGPVMALERVYRISGESKIFTALTLRVALHEVFREQRDVAIPVAKRRKLDACDVQTVKQVCAEVVVLHCSLESRIRTGNDASVERLLVRSTGSAKPPVLNDSEQLRLELERELRDFIQKDCAVVGDFQ